jgi:hypothetical protein
VLYLGKTVYVHRGWGHPAITNDLCRYALSYNALRAAIDQDGEVGVSMDVNEARSDEATTNINALLSLEGPSRCNLTDSTSSYGEVAPKPGIPTTIHDSAIGKDNVEGSHRTTLLYLEDPPWSCFASSWGVFEPPMQQT